MLTGHLRQIRNLSSLETGLFNSPSPNFRPYLRRFLFIIGLMLRHFDFNDPVVIEGLEVSCYEIYFII